MAEVIELDIRAKTQNLQFELDAATDRVKQLQKLAKNIPIGADSSGINLKLQLAKQEVEGLRSNLRQVKFQESLPKEIDEVDKGFSSILKKSLDFRSAIGTAAGFVVGNIAIDTIAGIGRAFSSSVESAREFGVEIARINSTLPNGIRLTKLQEQALLDLGDAYGRTGSQEAAAFFEIVSNGVEDTAVASDILKSSNEAALAGITSLDSAARLITTTFNAYAKQGATASEITDSLVVATQLSGVKFEELAESLGRVTSLAANSNISIGELSGTVAFLNKNSLTTEQAITGVRGILNAIIKPSEEASQIARRLGIEFSSTALESKGLVTFLAEVSKATGNNSTTLSRLFGDINAINSVIAISKGGFDSFRDSVDRASNSAGATAKAATELKTSLDFTLDRQDAAFKNLGATLGNLLRPAITLTAEALTGLTQALGSAFKTKGPDDLNKQIERTSQIITAIEQKDFYRLQNLGIQTTALSTAGLNRLLDEQIKKRDALTASAQKEEKARVTALPKKPSEPGAAPSGVPDNATEQELQARERLQAELSAIDQKAFFDRQSLAIELEAAEAARKEEAYLAQEDVELQRNTLAIEAAFQAEVAKNKAIQDANTQAIANKVAFNKKIAALDAEEQKRDIAASKRSLELSRATTQAELNIASSAVSLGAALAKEGDKTIFLASKAVGIAQAIVSTQVAAAKALALDPTGALAAKVTAAGNLNVATIAATAIKGFAEGGIIGNTQGATSGPDNRLATVRDGEMILNATQQKNLFDMINNGGTNAPIVIQIDGVEVFKAVRNQIQNGMRLPA